VAVSTFLGAGDGLHATCLFFYCDGSMVNMNENMEEQQNITPEGGDPVPANIQDIYNDAMREDKELADWNKKRKGYMEGTQLDMLRSHTGRFGNAFEFILDGEHDEEIRDVIGERNLKLFSTIAEPFLQSEATKEQLRMLVDIVGSVAEAPQFQKYVTRGLEEENNQTIQ
jgi:hypothetical protein